MFHKTVSFNIFVVVTQNIDLLSAAFTDYIRSYTKTRIGWSQSISPSFCMTMTKNLKDTVLHYDIWQCILSIDLSGYSWIRRSNCQNTLAWQCRHWPFWSTLQDVTLTIPQQLRVYTSKYDGKAVLADHENYMYRVCIAGAAVLADHENYMYSGMYSWGGRTRRPRELHV